MSHQHAPLQDKNTDVDPLKDSPLRATPSMCYCCFDSLIECLKNIKIEKGSTPDFVHELIDVSVECPLFVTWEKQHKQNWQLRGCIGSLSPKLLAGSVSEYALTSALRDRRFHPITIDEIPQLRVAVSLLVNYQLCQDVYDWTVGVHGILIKFTVGNQFYNATYLPEVAKEQAWTKEEAVESLIQKAGHRGPVSKELLAGIQCTRYKSAKHKITFQEYMTHKGHHPLLEEASTISTKRRRSTSSCNIN